MGESGRKAVSLWQQNNDQKPPARNSPQAVPINHMTSLIDPTETCVRAHVTYTAIKTRRNLMSNDEMTSNFPAFVVRY